MHTMGCMTTLRCACSGFVLHLQAVVFEITKDNFMTLLLPYQLAMIRATIQKRQAHNYQMIALRSSGALTSLLEKSDATLSLVHLDMIDTKSSRKQQSQHSPTSSETHAAATDDGSVTVSVPLPPTSPPPLSSSAGPHARRRSTKHLRRFQQEQSTEEMALPTLSESRGHTPVSTMSPVPMHEDGRSSAASVRASPMPWTVPATPEPQFTDSGDFKFSSQTHSHHSPVSNLNQTHNTSPTGPPSNFVFNPVFPPVTPVLLDALRQEFSGGPPADASPMPMPFPVSPTRMFVFNPDEAQRSISAARLFSCSTPVVPVADVIQSTTLDVEPILTSLSPTQRLELDMWSPIIPERKMANFSATGDVVDRIVQSISDPSVKQHLPDPDAPFPASPSARDGSPQRPYLSGSLVAPTPRRLTLPSPSPATTLLRPLPLDFWSLPNTDMESSIYLSSTIDHVSPFRPVFRPSSQVSHHSRRHTESPQMVPLLYVLCTPHPYLFCMSPAWSCACATRIPRSFSLGCVRIY
jgi:hypothetical protein